MLRRGKLLAQSAASQRVRAWRAGRRILLWTACVRLHAATSVNDAAVLVSKQLVEHQRIWLLSPTPEHEQDEHLEIIK